MTEEAAQIERDLDQSERYATAVNERDGMRELLATEGWKILSKNLEMQMQSFRATILQPVGANDLYKQEYKKGQMWLAEFMVNFPEKVIAAAEELLEGLDPATDVSNEPELNFEEDEGDG